MEKKKKYYLKHQDRINLIQMGAQTFFYSYMDLSLASHEEHPEICQKYEIRQTLGTQTLFSLFLLPTSPMFFFLSFFLSPSSSFFLLLGLGMPWASFSLSYFSELRLQIVNYSSSSKWGRIE